MQWPIIIFLKSNPLSTIAAHGGHLLLNCIMRYIKATAFILLRFESLNSIVSSICDTPVAAVGLSEHIKDSTERRRLVMFWIYVFLRAQGNLY